MAEAWVATYKAECVQGRLYPSFEHAEHDAVSWIGFYNHERLHEQFDDRPPVEYEALYTPSGVSPDAPRRQATVASVLPITTDHTNQAAAVDVARWPDRNEQTTQTSLQQTRGASIFTIGRTSCGAATDSEAFAEAIVLTLVGSIALILAVPAATALAALLALRLPERRLRRERVHLH
jgi:hypothetical protein